MFDEYLLCEGAVGKGSQLNIEKLRALFENN
jgi:hypothetical protein